MQGKEGLAWREAFDELLVFNQDFDTAMQILMFQDEKVARLSLEDPMQMRSQRARRTKTRRNNLRSPSRKRRRVESSQAAGPEPPSPPLNSNTQSSEIWSQWPSGPLEEEESQVYT
ncbi:Peptidase M23 [Phytophthora palmivora]|uniref:Peptidase M23 n=1 Tax=Phytophthora palmivora TaxID=4796 RepID=A0A2P4WYI3_9STRA|nr:Peptidase M23 [Phytophthora palmivora]